RADGKAEPGRNRDRKNVSVKLSYDEGETWPAGKTVEAGFSGYSDLAVAKDGTILLFYERGSTDGKNIYKTDRLTVARFNLEGLTDGTDARNKPCPRPPPAPASKALASKIVGACGVVSRSSCRGRAAKPRTASSTAHSDRPR